MNRKRLEDQLEAMRKQAAALEQMIADYHEQYVKTMGAVEVLQFLLANDGGEGEKAGSDRDLSPSPTRG